MEAHTYDLVALFRDVSALLLLLSNFSVLVLTVAGRELSNKGIVRAGCLLTLALLGLLNNGRGIFLNRWPALITVLVTLGFWALVRWVGRRVR